MPGYGGEPAGSWDTEGNWNPNEYSPTQQEQVNNAEGDMVINAEQQAAANAGFDGRVPDPDPSQDKDFWDETGDLIEYVAPAAAAAGLAAAAAAAAAAANNNNNTGTPSSPASPAPNPPTTPDTPDDGVPPDPAPAPAPPPGPAPEPTPPPAPPPEQPAPPPGPRGGAGGGDE